MEKENKELKEKIKKLEEHIGLLKTIDKLTRDAERLYYGADFGYPMQPPVVYRQIQYVPQYVYIPQYVPVRVWERPAHTLFPFA